MYATFEDFYQEHEATLRRMFCARYGPERGSIAAAESMAYAWQYWDRVAAMSNPAGYLYRVGQSRTRRLLRRGPAPQQAHVSIDPVPDPDLHSALGALTQRQRAVVILVDGFGYTLDEVADLLGITKSSVQKHRDRGLAHLKERLT